MSEAAMCGACGQVFHEECGHRKNALDMHERIPCSPMTLVAWEATLKADPRDAELDTLRAQVKDLKRDRDRWFSEALDMKRRWLSSRGCAEAAEAQVAAMRAALEIAGACLTDLAHYGIISSAPTVGGYYIGPDIIPMIEAALTTQPPAGKKEGE